MDSIRTTLIECLKENVSDEEKFLHELNRLIAKEGDSVYPVLLNVLTHLNFDIQDAKDYWEHILYHQKKISDNLGRQVNLATAICDFFSSIHKSLQNPKLIELMVFEETAKSSNLDGLTQLYNRYYFDNALSSEMKRAKRYSEEFSLVFFDLDDFKNLNDTLGHQAGDLALKKVAGVILAEKREEDLAARYGGEEMVLILPKTSKVNALVIAERIRQKVEELKLEFEHKHFNITTSGGVSSFPIDGEDSNNLLHAADMALYQAKAKGKNRVELHETNKRYFLRMDFVKDIRIVPDEEDTEEIIPGRSKNVSGSGILFESKDPLDFGEKVELQIPIRNDQPAVTVTGRVARVEKFDECYEIGVSFLTIDNQPDPHLAKTLAQYLGIPLENN